MPLLEEDTVVIEEILVEGYEKVLHIKDEKVGLKAIISLHSTKLGPTLGGVRIYPYATFQDALTDVLRLSKAMTYKSALTECRWGGGKSVIIADPKKHKSVALLHSFGRIVNSLEGIYICAEDVGCTPEDVERIAEITPYVTGLQHEKSSGNPSPFTAWGTFRGIQALLTKLYGSDNVEGKTVAVQGLGSVGSKLVEFLFWAGAKLIVGDIDEEKAQKIARQYNARHVVNSEIHKQVCDVFAPCALGGGINDMTIPELRCKAIGGCANNQLLQESNGNDLKRLGILYAPDFVINAGGLINVTSELEPGGYNPNFARSKTHQIYDQLLTIFEIAEQNGSSTNEAAIALGDYRIKYGVGKRLEPVEFPFANRPKFSE